jgi:hypothetical protein
VEVHCPQAALELWQHRLTCTTSCKHTVSVVVAAVVMSCRGKAMFVICHGMVQGLT